MRYYVFLSDESLLTWFYENGNRLIKVSAMFQLAYMYSQNAWFLDSWASMLVSGKQGCVNGVKNLAKPYDFISIPTIHCYCNEWYYLNVYSIIYNCYYVCVCFNSGTFVAKQQLDSVIVQARTTNELRYGRFLPSTYDVFTAPTCVYQNVSHTNKCMHDY